MKDVWIYDCKYCKMLQTSALNFFTNDQWLEKLHLAFLRKITKDPQMFLISKTVFLFCLCNQKIYSRFVGP